MLGDLARKLRFLGYDTVYVGEIERNNTRNDPMGAKPLDDGEILFMAREAGRIVLTKDVRFASLDPNVILLAGDDVKTHLTRMQDVLGVHFTFDQESSRCFQCNELLVKVPKETIRDKVQEKTYAAFEVFYQCPSCGQVFWRGAHFHQGKGGFLDPFTGLDPGLNKEDEGHA